MMLELALGPAAMTSAWSPSAAREEARRLLSEEMRPEARDGRYPDFPRINALRAALVEDTAFDAPEGMARLLVRLESAR